MKQIIRRIKKYVSKTNNVLDPFVEKMLIHNFQNKLEDMGYRRVGDTEIKDNKMYARCYYVGKKKAKELPPITRRDGIKYGFPI